MRVSIHRNLTAIGESPETQLASEPVLRVALCQVPWLIKGPFAFWTAAFAALARGLAGSSLDTRARLDNGDMQPIELWAYEGSPFVRPVRERLNELGLPHTVVFCPRGASAKRDLLVARTGRFQERNPILCLDATYSHSTLRSPSV